MTMNILVVDDEELARQRIESLLQDNSEYNICAEAENGAEALMARSDVGTWGWSM